MAQLTEEKLLEAIEKDDIKAFDALMENAQCGKYRLGRFPVLSLLYLYKCKKIIAAYEEKFIKTEAWEALKEPASIAKAFSEKAGKCLRLYLSEVVSPLEMLLILDETKRLKRVYPLTKPSEAVKDRLQSIYSMKYSLNIRFEGDGIIIDRRPLSRREKNKITTICLCSFLAVAIAVAAPVTTISLIPKRAEGEVTKLSHIDFGKKTTYTLKKDITIPASYAGKKMNCTIVGEGNKLIFEKGATLGEFSGKMQDLEIVSSGSPLFSSVTEKGELSGVKVNVSADIQTSQSSAFIALINCGKIDGVTLNVSGKLSAVAKSDEVKFGGMVLNNSAVSQYVYGTISNCTVNYSDFTLEGEIAANAIFGGVAGDNSGIVQDCTVTGKISSDTFDLGGICAVNNGILSGDINEASLTQVSASEDWSPIVGGIAATNSYVIEYCLSRGDIGVVGGTVYAGGIFGRSEIVKDIYGKIYFGIAEYCICESKIEVSAETTACAGGIGGYVQEGRLVNYDGSGGYFGGGISKCVFLGSNTKEINYFGAIVGVSGENIYYGTDLYQNDYHNFEDNYYVDDFSSACGATATRGEDNREQYKACTTDIGATAATEEEITALQIYKEILDKIGN